MRSVVTGGAGFLGSHLCDKLLARGDHVICLDNLITGSTDNIAHLKDNNRFEFIKLDVTNYISIAGEVDNVIHFASPASPIDYLQLPIQTLKVGSLGTHKALGLARAKKARFLLASTSEVYGDPQEHPQREEYWGHVNPIGFRGVYDEAKRFAEAITMAYHRVHGLQTRIVRIFNSFGPRMRLNDGRALPNFICQALRGDEITVYGDGSQTRSFDEAEPVNIGSPQEVSILDLAKLIIELTGSGSRIVEKPFPPEFKDDPKVRQPDITKARALLQWEPQYSLRDGLAPTIEYFRNKLEC